MFVGDWYFAPAIVIWVFAYWLLIMAWVKSPAWAAGILLAGLTAILFRGVALQARKQARARQWM